jgi:hypothetical protein
MCCPFTQWLTIPIAWNACIPSRSQDLVIVSDPGSKLLLTRSCHLLEIESSLDTFWSQPSVSSGPSLSTLLSSDILFELLPFSDYRRPFQKSEKPIPMPTTNFSLSPSYTACLPSRTLRLRPRPTPPRPSKNTSRFSNPNRRSPIRNAISRLLIGGMATPFSSCKCRMKFSTSLWAGERATVTKKAMRRMSIRLS